jgi:hypothetical protein
VAIYCFAGGPLAICNHRNELVEVEIRAASNCPLGRLDGLSALPGSGATVESADSDRLKMQLPARSRVLLSA